MTTYSKETALYDTGAIANGIGAAGETATKYLTTITGTNGISVHDANDNKNFVNMNSTDGVTIYRDINGVATDVANFGETARIGIDEYARVEIGATSLEAYNSSNTKYFDVSENGVSIANGKITMDSAKFVVGNSGWSSSVGHEYDGFAVKGKSGSAPVLSGISLTLTGGSYYINNSNFEQHFVDGRALKYITLRIDTNKGVGRFFRLFDYGVNKTQTVTIGGSSISILYSDNAKFTFTLPSGVTISNVFCSQEMLMVDRIGVMIGEDLTSESIGNGLVIGTSNVDVDDAFFVIGNGGYNYRNNALEVAYDGNIRMDIRTQEDLYTAISDLGWTSAVIA